MVTIWRGRASVRPQRKSARPVRVRDVKRLEIGHGHQALGVKDHLSANGHTVQVLGGKTPGARLPDGQAQPLFRHAL